MSKRFCANSAKLPLGTTFRKTQLWWGNINYILAPPEDDAKLIKQCWGLWSTLLLLCGATFVKVMPLKQNVKWCHLKRNQILESSKVSTGKSGHVWKQHFDGEKKHGKLPPTPATVTFSQKWRHQAVTAGGKNTVNLRKKQVFAGVA